jgi:peptide/nickel transport system permease protein
MMALQEKATNRWQRTMSIMARVGKLPMVPGVPAIILITLCVVAVFAPFIAPYPPLEGNLPEKLLPPFWAEGGSPSHLLGTDFFGRDVLSRLIYGARISLLVVISGVLVSGSVGLTAGLISGYLGRWVDTIVMRATDVGLSIPYIVIAVVLTATLGPGLFNVVLVILLLYWPRYARMVRAETLVYKEQDFVALARVAGCSHAWIVWRHIFPNLVPTLLVLSTLEVGNLIILESMLSFLGVGLPANMASWGIMVSDGRAVISTAWWIFFFPGLCIFCTVMSANLMGDWLRDRLDPKLREI